MVGYTLSVRRFKEWSGWDAPINWPAAQPGVTWPLTPLRSQGVPRRSLPRILDSQPNSILHSLRAGRISSPTPPHYAYVCVLRWDLWAVRGPCLAVVEHVLRMRGRPGRRGGSKACLGVGASYHWYPWDLYLIFSPLTYNGEVTKLTWPKVTDIKNPKYTNCRHLCPYCTLRVLKSSDHWCAFGTMSNFEKRNLRSGHLMWPGGVTFGVIGSSFFWKCVKLLAEQLWQYWRRYAPPFFRYLRKTWGGLISAPWPCAG